MLLIEKVKLAFSSMNMLNKILLSYVVIVVIPLVIAGYYSYNALSSGVYREYYKMSASVNDLLCKNLNYHFTQMDNIVNSIIYNKDLVAELENANKIEDRNSSLKQQISKLNSTQRIEYALISITSMQDSCIDAGIYTLNGDIYHTSKFRYGLSNNILDKYRSASWFLTAMMKNGKRYFIGTHKQEQITNGTTVISMTKLLKIDINNNLGVILIDYDLGVFRGVYGLVNLNPEDNIYIADDTGTIVYEKNEKLIGKKLPSQLSEPVYKYNSKEFSAVIDNKSYFVTASIEDMSGWKFITVLSDKNLLRNFSSLQKIFILFTFVSFILISMVYYFIVKFVFKPIKSLAENMNMAAKGDLSIRFESKRNDEIGIIGKSFNYMVSSIAESISEQKKSEQKLRQSEIHALQAQINPHFMYNTLNAVRWMAIEIGGDKIRKMVEALISLLKNTIYRKERLLTIEKEFNNLENFVYIMNIRYEGRFTLINNIGAECGNYFILKMLLQPIVENSIYHGFRDDLQTDCTIEINCRLKDGKLYIDITDNGKGIEKKDLSRVLSIRSAKLNGFSGVGVSNVDERIRLNYGDEYGLKISSVTGEGTTVTLVLPMIENEEDSENA